MKFKIFVVQIVTIKSQDISIPAENSQTKFFVCNVHCWMLIVVRMKSKMQLTAIISIW